MGRRDDLALHRGYLLLYLGLIFTVKYVIKKIQKSFRFLAGSLHPFAVTEVETLATAFA